MKKIMLALGLMFATLTLTNCSQEFDENITPDNAQKTFAVTANIPATRTSIDGMETSWVAGDKIALFYNDNYAGIYTNSAADLDRFEGTEPTLDDATAYTWYALYPANFKESSGSITDYNSGRKPTNTAYDNVGYQSVDQDGYNSTAHVCNEYAPLWGKTTTEAGTTSVSFTMKHLCSMLAIKVTNTTGEPIVINSASFSSDKQDFVGTYNLNLTENEVVYTASGTNYVYKTATVNVKNAGELVDGETAVLYMPIKPFANVAGETFTLSVVTNNGTSEKTLKLDTANTTVFEAGVIKPLTISIESVKSNAIELPWMESFDSEDLSKYVTINGSSTTKVYADGTLAKGAAAGEILISQGGGSMTATLASDGSAKTLNFWFKSNKDFIEVSSATEGVTITKLSNYGYTVVLAEGVEEFKLTLANNGTNGNARVDDIVLTTEAPSIASLSILNQTLSFTAGDEFVFDGTVNAVYENGVVVENVTGYIVDDTDVDMGAAGTCTVTVSYEDVTTTYDIFIEAAGVKTNTDTLTMSTIFNDTATNLSNGTTYEWGDFKVTFTKINSSTTNYNASDDGIRWYKNDILEFAHKNGYNITKIVINTTKIDGAPTANTGNISTVGTTSITWDGKATSVAITAAGGQIRFKSIAITYEVSSGDTTDPDTPEQGGDTTVTINPSNINTSYNKTSPGAEITIEDVTFYAFYTMQNASKIQMYKNSGFIANKTSLGAIKTITITYNSSDSNKNCVVYVGDSELPDSTTIEASTSGNVYTFDCTSGSYSHFKILNGSGAGYIDSITITYAK